MKILVWISKKIGAFSSHLRDNNRVFLIAISLVILLALVIYLTISNGTGFGAYQTTITDSTGKIISIENHPAKTFWDLLNLLIVPGVLAVAALLFNASQQKREQAIADDHQKESVLQAYLENMGKLLIDKDLLKAKDMDESPVRDYAQVLTTTALRSLNTDRQNILLQFLRDSHLSNFILRKTSLGGSSLSGAHLEDIDLAGADLTGTILTEAHLSGAILHEAKLSRAHLINTDLRKAKLAGANLTQAFLRGALLLDTEMSQVVLDKADLRGVNLDHADLHKASLIEANLSKANLRSANMSNANLHEARLANANLTGVILNDADLSGAIVTNEQLSRTPYFHGAIMPDGTKYRLPDLPDSKS